MTEKDNNQIVPVEEHHISPKDTVEFANAASKQLKDIVDKTKSSVRLGSQGTEHLKFEAWQTIGKFYGCSVSIEWTKPVTMKDKEGEEIIFGFEARAKVIDSKGRELSAAESGCFKDEPNWANKPAFQVRSMAQTRAAAKALRNVFAWVVVLAGYNPTPSEEMDGINDKPGNTLNSNSALGKRIEKEIQSQKPKTNEADMVCQKCKDELSEKVFNYSMQKLGKPFCYNCQEKIKEELSKIPKEFHSTPKSVKKTDSDNDAEESHI